MLIFFFSFFAFWINAIPIEGSTVLKKNYL